jgi:transketolase
MKASRHCNIISKISNRRSLLVSPLSTSAATTTISAKLKYKFQHQYVYVGHNSSNTRFFASSRARAKVIATSTITTISNNTSTMTYTGSDLELECINTIRAVSADCVQSANSGHPGAPMGCAPIAYLLWTELMKYSPSSPDWMNRDRFVLSNGHACALQYVMLHLTGYETSKLEDLKRFRQLGSTTPGHPECFVTKGVEVCTGPLGQGISNAVGLAMAESHLAATYNTEDLNVFDNYTYVLCGDGCLQEGISGEASSLGGHLGLGKLIVFYDDNDITIDGSTSLSFTEDVQKRYESYGWHVQAVDDVCGGLDALRKAVEVAKSVTDKPSMIAVKTVIGQGSPHKAGTAGVHGAALGEKELILTKKAYGLPHPEEKFQISDDVKAFFTALVAKKEAELDVWQTSVMDKFAESHPTQAQEIQRRMMAGGGYLPEGCFDDLPKFVIGESKDLATRKFSEGCINALVPKLPELIGGSADLTPSNCTFPKGALDYQKETPEGKYIRFGVREHGMAAICNGLFAYGGLRPYCATFMTFVGYCMGSVRISALSKFGIIYVFTHDSIGLGEDGPTHQPIEQFEQIRSMPNIHLWRPADSNEMNASWKSAMEHSETPSIIACSRSTVMGLYGSTIEKAQKGAYIAIEAAEEKPALVIVSTGGEVGFCVKAIEKLVAAGIATQLVSMPCMDVFLEQSKEYQESVLPGNVPTLSVEAAATAGWHRFSHAQIGMENTFGASGNGGALYEHFGFTPENICNKGQALIDYYKGKSVPNLNDRPNFYPFAKPLH